MKTARRTFGDPYECKYEWAEDCFVQCGENGLVLKVGLEKALCSESVDELVGTLKEHTSYTTALFEAFPRNPNTFIRGEGKTVEEAEESAWKKFTKYSACDHPEFEKRGYTNGAGFCILCEMFKSKAFEPWEDCSICGEKTYFDELENGSWICELDYYKQPYESLQKYIKLVYSKEEWEKRCKEKQ